MGEFREDVNNDRNGGARFETTGRDTARKRTAEEGYGLKERFAGSKLRNGEILREKHLWKVNMQEAFRAKRKRNEFQLITKHIRVELPC